MYALNELLAIIKCECGRPKSLNESFADGEITQKIVGNFSCVPYPHTDFFGVCLFFIVEIREKTDRGEKGEKIQRFSIGKKIDKKVNNRYYGWVLDLWMACWLGHRWPVGDTGWEIGKDQIGRSNKVRKLKVIKKYRCVDLF